MNKKKIFIIGSGRLANAILSSNLSFPEYDVIKWENQHRALNESCLLVHVGSGRQLDECLEFCSKTGSVFIELSTGSETESITRDFPLIICPNTSILLLKTLRMIKLSGGNFEKYDISITESHQSTKNTPPGTAFHFADALKVTHEKIISVRDPQIQKNEIGIPKDFLEGHAYHKIVIKDINDEVTIETKVLGHDSYANGVRAIIAACLSHRLENKRYTVFDLIENEML
jgi:4-hydroxy-tetrahydrodipicolinate reductase